MTRWLTTCLFAAAACLPLQLLQADEGVAPERVQKLRKMANQIQGKVETLRGLKFSRNVPKGIQTRQQLRKTMREEFERSMPKDQLQDYQQMLAKVGLIPGDLDLGKLMINIYTEAVAGFYDPRTQRLYLIANPKNDPNEDPAMKMQRMMLKMVGVTEEQIIMAHELTHALQDQNFDLLQLDLDKMTNDDQLTAIKSLIEGDATVLMYDFMLKRLGMDSKMLERQGGRGGGMMGPSGSKALDSAPRYIKYGMIVPYMTGMKFVAAIKGKGGWAAVNKMYNDPPASMEQVMHPEKYLDRDQPTRLSLNGFTRIFKKAGYKRIGTDTLGELYMGVLLGDLTGDDTAAKEAAKGWDGDRYAVYRNAKGHTSMVLASTFDTEEDAKQFFRAYRSAQKRKKLKTAWISQSGKDVWVLEDHPKKLEQALVKGFSRLRRWEYKGGKLKLPKLQKAAKAPSPTTQRSAGPKMPFGYKLPEGWTAKRSKDRQYPLTVHTPNGSELRIGILRTQMTAGQAGRAFQKMVPNKVSEYRKVKSGPLPRDGRRRPGYFHSFQGSKQGKRGIYQYVQIVLQGQGKLYSLMFATAVSKAQQEKPALHQFVEDFRER